MENIKVIPLQNVKKEVVIDDFVFNHIKSDDRLESLNFLSKLREHSSGLVVFQKWTPKPVGNNTSNVETIYLHRYIAENFVPIPQHTGFRYAYHKNGDRLDCRVENIAWGTRTELVRVYHAQKQIPFNSIQKDHGRYRATIYGSDNSFVYIGTFDTVEKAKIAYNKKLEELKKTNNEAYTSLPMYDLHPKSISDIDSNTSTDNDS